MRSQTQLPKYVSLSNNGYRYNHIWAESTARSSGERVYVARRWCPMSEVWRAFEDIQSRSRNTVGWVLSLYDSDRFANLKEKNRNDYSKGWTP